jgi:hypothetical protein
MAEVRLNQIRKSRLARWTLLATPFALGFAAVALADHQASLSLHHSAIQLPASSVPSVTATPLSETNVTVNGKPVPVDGNGSANVNLPNGDGNVEISNGGTTVHTSSGGSGKSGSGTSSNHVSVNINSDSGPTNSSGFSWSSTHVNGNSVTGSSHSFSSTNVFSSGSSNVVTSTH